MIDLQHAVWQLVPFNPKYRPSDYKIFESLVYKCSCHLCPQVTLESIIMADLAIIIVLPKYFVWE